MSGIKIQTKSSEPIQAREDVRITLVSQSTSWIEKTWGLAWNRPVSVQVEADGATQVIPIVDVTRIAQIFLWGLTAGFGLLILKKSVKKKE